MDSGHKIGEILNNAGTLRFQKLSPSGDGRSPASQSGMEIREKRSERAEGQL